MIEFILRHVYNYPCYPQVLSTLGMNDTCVIGGWG